jgi:hypothetical protein
MRKPETAAACSIKEMKGIDIFDSARILFENKFSAAPAADVKAAGSAAQCIKRVQNQPFSL